MKQLKRKSLRKTMNSKKKKNTLTKTKMMEKTNINLKEDDDINKNNEEICKEMYSIYQNVVIGYILLKDVLKSIDNIKSTVENIERCKREKERDTELEEKEEEEEEEEYELQPPCAKKVKVSCGFENVRFDDKEILNDFALVTKHLLSYSNLLGKSAFKLLFNEKVGQLYNEFPKIMENINTIKETINFGFNKNDFDNYYTNDIIQFVNKENIQIWTPRAKS